MNSRRTYRQQFSSRRFRSFQVSVKQTDLWVAVSPGSYHPRLEQEVEQLVWRQRRQIELFIEQDPWFGTTLEPYLIHGSAPEIVLAMVKAGNRVGVGPMAAVAGALSEIVGNYLSAYSDEVIVENGGDLFLHVIEPVNVGIYAGNSPVSGKMAIRVKPCDTPAGICTSSGTVGPAYSKGRADAAVVISPSATLADAAATALGNMVSREADMKAALNFARRLEGIDGALLVCGEQIAVWGSVQLVPASGN
jgi:ApbE superfamily uncharacterized protein (UPF0280 family)